VSDVVGDAMLAIWPDRTPDTRSRVLHALLEMLDAVSEFNAKLAGNKLNTRFGVDWGRVALTTVGSDVHYEYRAVGDAVNTAQRIQELNKRLKTRILVSGPLMTLADGEFLSRDLGSFLLRGKSHPVRVHELMGLTKTASAADVELCTRSAAFATQIDQGDVESVRTSLMQARLSWPSDGPLQFLASALEGGIARENGAWVVN
jgi:adenylate cyclase